MEEEEIYVSEIIDEELQGKYKKYINNNELSIHNGIDENVLVDYIEKIENLNEQLENFEIEINLNEYLDKLKSLDNNIIKDTKKKFKNRVNDLKKERQRTFEEVKFPYEILEIPYKERINLLEEDKKRYENGIPHGYKDYQQKDRKLHEYRF